MLLSPATIVGVEHGPRYGQTTPQTGVKGTQPPGRGFHNVGAVTMGRAAPPYPDLRAMTAKQGFTTPPTSIATVQLVQATFTTAAGSYSQPTYVQQTPQSHQRSLDLDRSPQRACQQQGGQWGAPATMQQPPSGVLDASHWLDLELQRLTAQQQAGAEDPQSNVQCVFLLYDENGDLTLDFDEFATLIADLMCLRDGVLYMDAQVAKAAAHAILNMWGGLQQHITPEVFVQRANSWRHVLTSNTVKPYLGGPARLRYLHDPELPDLINGLREQRNAELEKHQRSAPWIFEEHVGNPPGLAGSHVREEILSSQNGWHFVDHGNGEGVVYWWPTAADRPFGTTLDARPVKRLQHIGGKAACTAFDSAYTMPSDNMSILDLAHRMPSLSATADQTTEDTSKLAEAKHNTHARLASMGASVKECGSQGDCFFNSLGFMLYGNEHVADVLRAKTVAYMRTHREWYEPFLSDTLLAEMRCSSFDEYCNLMARQGTWVQGGVELEAAAQVTNANIKIWGETGGDDRDITVRQPNGETRNVSIVHFLDHYTGVVPLLRKRVEQCIS